MARYIAKLTGNTRTNRTKVLLVNIRPDASLGKDHCWITITNAIEKLMPKGHQKPIYIEFDAQIKEYLARGTTPSLTLKSLRNIKKFKPKA